MIYNDVDLGVEREFDFEWPDILRRDPCAFCGEPGETVDHIIPKARGGKPSTAQNGTGSCYHCNALKRRMSLLDFLLRRERLERNFNRRQKSFFSQEQIDLMRRVVA